MNWRRHARFFWALLIGVAAGLVAPWPLTDRILLGGDLFFAIYLALAFHYAVVAGDGSGQQANPDEEDESGLLIVSLALVAIILSLSAVYGALANQGSATHLRLVLAVVTVPLGWATLHMLMAVHYAAGFHRRVHGGGLDFPGDQPPGVWDFIYFSFTLGMTAQTSDVAITSTRMRRMVTAHSVISFFYNTVILALMVNVAVALA